MGDEGDGLADGALDLQELVLEAVARDRVDGAERLVHEHDGRVGGQGPGDADTLLLAAGELARVAVAERRGLEPDEVEQLVGPRPDPLLVPAEHLRDHADVVGDGEVREETALLDDVADLAAQEVAVDVGDVLAVEQDAARGRLDEPVDHLERRRLAAARGADEHDDLALLDVEGQVLHGRHLGAGIGLAHLFEVNLRHGAHGLPFSALLGCGVVSHDQARRPRGVVNRWKMANRMSSTSPSSTVNTTPTQTEFSELGRPKRVKPPWM